MGREAHGAAVTIAPGWSSEVDDETLRQALLTAFTHAPDSAPTTSARPSEVRELVSQARDSLLDGADGLPTFMRGPIHDSVERVHDGVTQALALPLTNEGGRLR